MTLLATASPTRSGVRIRRMRYEPEPGSGGPPPPAQPVSSPVDEYADDTDHDAVHELLGRVLRLAMEVFDGRRPLTQLAPHFSRRALRYWRVAGEQRIVRAPARIDRVITGFPRTGAVEVAAVCSIDGRIRALAARFEQASPTARWRCTDLRLG
jgi:hypothetical protein